MSDTRIYSLYLFTQARESLRSPSRILAQQPVHQSINRRSTNWERREDFEAWTKSESFKEAHSGRSRTEIFAGRPNLEVHEVIRTVAQPTGS